jgi:hypothetical protein
MSKVLILLPDQEKFDFNESYLKENLGFVKGITTDTPQMQIYENRFIMNGSFKNIGFSGNLYSFLLKNIDVALNHHLLKEKDKNNYEILSKSLNEEQKIDLYKNIIKNKLKNSNFILFVIDTDQIFIQSE